MTLYVDGRRVDDGPGAAGFGLPAAVRKRGVFTTLAITQGVPLFLEDHIARLHRDAAAMALAPVPAREIKALLASVLSDQDIAEGVVKIGLAATDRNDVGGESADWYLSFELPRPSAGAVDLLLAELPDSGTRAVKGMWREDWDHAVRQGRAAGCNDVLAIDRGRVLETSICNLFVATGSSWITPRADGSILPGIARARLLNEGIGSAGDVALEDLASATGVFVCNSVRGVVPVGKVLRADGSILWEGGEADSSPARPMRSTWDALVGREIALWARTGRDDVHDLSR